MSPRKTRSSDTKARAEKHGDTASTASKVKDEKEDNEQAGDKRKLKEEDDAEEDGSKVSEEKPPSKAQRTTKKSSPSPAGRKTPNTMIDWLLSDEAFSIANPEIPKGHGETDWSPEEPRKAPPPEDAGKNSTLDDNASILRYPQSHLTPFQNLVAACLLSKPISHKLGLRTIQTLLNPPFGLRTLQDLDDAGYEGRRKVMWEARTQHKEKTAKQLGDVCAGVKELCGDKNGDEELNKLQDVKDILKDMKSPREAQKILTDQLTKIKGIGSGVAGIFLRRVQADWSEVFPFADQKSIGAARKLGLIDEKGTAETLAKLVDNDREKFVKLLDTLIGLELEKKMDEALAKAD